MYRTPEKLAKLWEQLPKGWDYWWWDKIELIASIGLDEASLEDTPLWRMRELFTEILKTIDEHKEVEIEAWNCVNEEVSTRKSVKDKK